MSNAKYVPAGEGWCYLVMEDGGRCSAGFRIALWQVNEFDEVVGMVAASTPSDFHEGRSVPRLVTVPSLKGRYAHWDDLSSEVRRQISKQ